MLFLCGFWLLFLFLPGWDFAFVAVSTAVIYNILVQPQVKLCLLQSLLCSSRAPSLKTVSVSSCFDVHCAGEEEGGKKIRNGVLSQTPAPARIHLPNQPSANKYFFS